MQEIDIIPSQVIGGTIDSLFQSNIFKSDEVLKHICTNILDILENNPINSETQIKLENFLYNQFKDLANKKDKVLVSNVDFSLFNSEFKHYCYSKVSEFSTYLDLLRESLDSNQKLNQDIEKIVKSVDIHDYYIKKLLNNMSDKEIISYLFYLLFLVVTFNNMILEDNELKEDEKTKIGLTSLSMNIGKLISNAYISRLYKEFKKSNTESEKSINGFKEYKENFLCLEKQHVFMSSEFYLRISGKLIEIMSSSGVLEIKVHTSNESSLVILTLTKEVEKLLSKLNPIAVLPINVPMIVPPKKYSKEALGGYYLNDVEYDETLISRKRNFGIPSEIEDNNVIYNSINNMMRTPFKVNKDLLNYLLEYNYKHKLLISSDQKHKLENIKRTKIQEKEYQQFLSKKILERYILLIAHIFSKSPEIYFPLKLDQRGRLYPVTAYLHYQGNELAKSLISFANPDILKRTDKEAIEYLKAYGATCYGHGLNRKSYSKRLE